MTCSEYRGHNEVHRYIDEEYGAEGAVSGDLTENYVETVTKDYDVTHPASPGVTHLASYDVKHPSSYDVTHPTSLEEYDVTYRTSYDVTHPAASPSEYLEYIDDIDSIAISQLDWQLDMHCLDLQSIIGGGGACEDTRKEAELNRSTTQDCNDNAVNWSTNMHRSPCLQQIQASGCHIGSEDDMEYWIPEARNLLNEIRWF